jgi:hypothetical protein
MKEDEPQGKSQECGKASKEKHGISDPHAETRQQQLDENRKNHGDREAEEPCREKRSQDVHRRRARTARESEDEKQKEQRTLHRLVDSFS